MRALRLMALALLLPSGAVADFEITPLVGTRQGTVELSAGVGCIALDGVRCPALGRSEDSSSLGFLLDLPLREGLDFELLVNRQDSEISFYYDDNELVPDVATSGFEVTHLHVGLRKRWELGRFEPFGAFGAGVTLLESARLFNGPIDLQRGSASVAAGARLRLSQRLGLRLEGRAYRVDLPDELVPFMRRLSSSDFDQTELSAGLGVRF